MGIRDRLTVAVLSYSVSPKLRICLESIRTHLPSCKTVVWDNGSTDDSVLMVRREFPDVEMIRSPENLLFAEGCNHLIQQCRTEYVLLMNADIFLQNDPASDILSFMEAHEDLIAVSPAVKDAGRLRHLAHEAITPALAIARDSVLGKVLQRTQWYHRALFENVQPDEVFCAPKITNCCCIIRRDRFVALGGFHPDQLLYWTEEDFALRAAKAGYRQAVFGKCSVVHEHGSSTAKLPFSFLRAIVVRDRISYMRRHFGFLATIIVELAVFFRFKLWYSIYYWYSFFTHRRELNRMASVVERYRHARIQGKPFHEDARPAR